MVRHVDYESRKKSVLGATINQYIRKAIPVASDEIASSFDLSPATIRNIFAELEHSGYLTHPYTSGGRIPTDKGYRYYVDFLLSQMELLAGEKEQISLQFRREVKELDEALENATEVIASFTHCTGIVYFQEWQDKYFYKGVSCILEQPEFHNLEKMRTLIKLLEEKQNILEVINRDFPDKVKVYIGEEMGFPEIDNCSLIVSSYRRRNKPSGKLAVLGPARMEYNHIIPTLEYVSNVLTDVLDNI
ncbi:MAG: hypothetical protein WC417_06480 [Candidatus Omnitrophota bacterium]|jgi:heat-inducible transcriptional repressor